MLANHTQKAHSHWKLGQEASRKMPVAKDLSKRRQRRVDRDVRDPLFAPPTDEGFDCVRVDPRSRPASEVDQKPVRSLPADLYRPRLTAGLLRAEPPLHKGVEQQHLGD